MSEALSGPGFWALVLMIGYVAVRAAVAWATRPLFAEMRELATSIYGDPRANAADFQWIRHEIDEGLDRGRAVFAFLAFSPFLMISFVAFIAFEVVRDVRRFGFDTNALERSAREEAREAEERATRRVTSRDGEKRVVPALWKDARRRRLQELSFVCGISISPFAAAWSFLWFVALSLPAAVFVAIAIGPMFVATYLRRLKDTLAQKAAELLA